MPPSPPRDLFNEPETTMMVAAVQPPGLFADVVFDRPLDHPYTYAVPERLRDVIAVGKRVEASFGKGDRATAGYCVRLTEDAPPREVKELTRVLDDEVLLDDALMRLTRWMADYYLCGWGQVLHAVIPAGAKSQAGVRNTVFVQAVPKPELDRPVFSLTPKQKAVLEKLRRQTEPVDQLEFSKSVHCTPGLLNSLAAKGLVRQTTRRVDRFVPAEDAGGEPAPAITLNEDQVRVWRPIASAIQAGGFHAFLLHGVTGSGKTEVYLRAIEEVVRQGKEAIVLVPEISLTPQTIERFKGRCGEVAVLHSHLGDVERGGYWRRIAAGMVQVVVGARSAVFAPTRKLGLIVIDEEHEGSFKQESTPRYHARDVAVMRARLEGVPIIMGSATPALESWHNAERGQYTLLTLPNRVLDRPLPNVQLVDLRHEATGKGRHHAIGLTLELAMKDALKAGGQVMLLLNRRGFATHVHCPGCGYVLSCANCDLAMTFHRQRKALLCHYCAYEQQPVERCPKCKESAVRYQGLGTEKLQAEIEEKFPEQVVHRMDSDTMQRPGSHARVLEAFRGGLINILLGTQMIAKGLDFPNVTLVGVINADVGLHLPDFRSAERTFQLLAQVAGRTGRGPRGGKVLIQTFTPEHPCIALAATHDYVSFVKRELEVRKTFNYPPYHRMARMIVRSERQELAEGFAGQLAGAFRHALRAAPGVRVLGPAEAPVFRLNNYYRYHFQVQSASAAVLHTVLREVLGVARAPAGVEFQLDVDPFNML